MDDKASYFQISVGEFSNISVITFLRCSTKTENVTSDEQSVKKYLK